MRAWMKGLLLGAMAVLAPACTSRPAAADSGLPIQPPDGTEVRIVQQPGQPTVVAFQTPALPAGQAAALQARCDGGELEACAEAGSDHQGQGRHAEAELAWRFACDRGHADSCFLLGNLLTNPFLKLGKEGDGVRALQRACEGKSGPGCYFLGVIYEQGQAGEKADPARARGFYEQGCRHGHHWACEKTKR